jgi:FkbM family methyltransferase
MFQFTKKLAQAQLGPKLPVGAWWAWRTLGFARPGRLRGRVWRGPESARLEWADTGELLQGLSIFDPANPWNRWTPAGEISTVVDLGANIGQTVAYWALRFPRARIGAVEMMPENAARVEHHGQLNRWKLQVVAVAAADKEGSVAVQRNAASARNRLEEFTQASAVREGVMDEKMVVPALPLGAILDRLGFAEADLMKVDIEGAESMLLRDAANWAPRVRTLLIEIHDNIDAAWAGAVLGAAGYQIELLELENRTEWLCSRPAPA